MTQKECLDSVKSRADQLSVSLALDDQFILTYMNHVVREVNTFAFPANPDFYVVQAVDIIATPQLPLSMLGGLPIRVNATDPDDASVNDARYAGTPDEAWKVTANTRNPATNLNPLYFIGDHTTNYRTLTILPSTIVVATADLWELPADLATDGSAAASTVPVPAGWEVAVIYGTFLECLNKITAKDQLESAQKIYYDTLAQLSHLVDFTDESIRMNTTSMPPQKGNPQ